MKACRNCRMISLIADKTCPKCNGELSERFSGMLIVLDPEHSEIAKTAGINVLGTYAVRVK